MLDAGTKSVDSNNDAQIIWNECLKRIKELIPPMTFNTWFTPIKPIRVENSVLTVQLPGNFFYEWLDEHYKHIINDSVKFALNKSASIQYIIVDDVGNNDLPADNDTFIIEPTLKEKNNGNGSGFESFLNPKYTFDNFIKGENNQLARAAAVAISENPGGTSFNPFFVYGGVGLGKTHLIQALGNKIISSYPQKKIRYISADQFTVDFVAAITQNKPNEFSDKYKDIDVLILDDIQYLIGKERTQDLFFRIFNNLHQAKKQIILSSDKPPKDLKGLDDRLVSRFNWGLTADIQPPDLETRIAILSKKTEEFNIHLDIHIMEYIAQHITSNIRELEGCLIKLLAHQTINSKEIDIDTTKRVVKEISTSRKVPIGIDVVTRITCKHLNIDEDKVREKTRKQEIVFARQLCMYLSKEMTDSSLKTIGLHFGGRDHSTVIHACTSIEEMSISDKKTRELIDDIKNKIELACL